VQNQAAFGFRRRQNLFSLGACCGRTVERHNEQRGERRNEKANLGVNYPTHGNFLSTAVHQPQHIRTPLSLVKLNYLAGAAA
ncbi:MAG TPA: hypothetical protein VNT76_00845, partial [Candidatus Binatus sp.]|nr:hypothetical protein [Candidatus Binatus sp.]